MYNNPSQYNKEVIPKYDKTLGYYYFIDREHPLSDKNGKVYHHRHVLSVKIGKWVDKSYSVHHIDGDRGNNDPSNLEQISPTQHVTKHHKERKYNIRRKEFCKNCNKSFISRGDIQYCCVGCSKKDSGKKIQKQIDKNYLEKLVWEVPTTHIALMFGCSDVAIAKLCKKWGIIKPGRGYWVKLKYNKLLL